MSVLAVPAGAQEAENNSSTSAAADLAVVVTGAGDSESESIVEAIVNLDGVSSVVVDSSADDALVYFVRVDDDFTHPKTLASIGADAAISIAELSPQSESSVGGQLLAEDQIGRQFSTSSLFIGLALAISGIFVAAIFGWRRSALAVVCSILAVGVAAEFGGAVAGDFNGSVASTTLPAILIGSVMTIILALRLLAWSERLRTENSGSTVRLAVTELCPEVAMVLASLFVLSGFAELVQSGRSALTVAAAGAAAAALTIFALLPVALFIEAKYSTIESADLAESESRLPISVPDGADQPVLFLVGGAILLSALAAFTFGTPGRQFIDASSLSEQSDQAIVGERLAIVGDQTAPIKATFDAATGPDVVAEWAMAAAEFPDIVRVETAAATFSGGSLTEEVSFPSVAFEGTEPVAFAIPLASPRSDAAQQAVVDVSSLDGSLGSPLLSGPSVDATIDGPSRTDLLLLVAVAAILVGIGAVIVTRNMALGFTSGVLRLLFGAAALGLYSLVIPGATGAELSIVLAMTTTLAFLFDLEFLEQALASDHERPTQFLLRNPGETSLLGIAFLGLACVMLLLAALFGGGPTAGQIGFGLLFVALVEGAAGGFVSRPALLGQRGAFHTFARPMRVALSSSKRVPGPDEVEGDPHWKRVVSDLLQSEYQLQVSPEAAEVSRVFVVDTPLARQAAVQSRSLHQAGLRITGRGPRLRRITTISQQSPISLAVTVEHPARQLEGADGAVVGIRKAEVKRGVLWLAERTDGTYRIAESVELESTDVDEASLDLSFSSESAIGFADSDIELLSNDGVVSSEPLIVVSDGEAELSLTETGHRTAGSKKATVTDTQLDLDEVPEESETVTPQGGESGQS